MSKDKHRKITFRDYGPDDPFYSEGPRSYSPHWARTLRSTVAFIKDVWRHQS
jgi:hypothetical protein